RHVDLNQVHGDMPWAFNHGLYVMLPGNLRQLTQCFKLSKLGLIVRIGNGAGPKSVAEAERDVVGFHDFADLFKMRVEKVLGMMGQAPFGQDGTTTRNDTRHPFGCQWDIAQSYASVNGEIVHTLFGLLNERVAEDFPRQLLGFAVYFFQRLVDWHSSDGYRAVAQDPFASLMNIAARGQIHHGIGAPTRGPDHFLDFLFNRRSNGRVSNVGIDLHQEIAADD